MSVIIYARVSTSKQGEKDLSIPAQIRTLRRLCSERGWTIAGTFTAVKELRAAAELEVNKAHQTIGADQVERCLNEEVDACNRALAEGDIGQIMKYVPGKELLNAIAPKIGCRDALMLARAARKHLKVDDFPHLVSLRQQLLA